MAAMLHAVAAVAFFHLACADTLLYVDCAKGSDAGPGTAAAPFLTLARARDAIRALPRPLSAPVTVTVAPGLCTPSNFSQPLLALVETMDSGEPGAPITWQGTPGATQLSSGLPIPSAAWVATPAQPGCFAAPLRGLPGYDAAFGLGALRAGGLGQCASGKAALFLGASATTLARWPNLGQEGQWNWLYATAASSAGGGSVTVNSSRPLDKQWPASAWLHGFWQYDWADSYVRLRGASSCGAVCTVLAVNASTPPVYSFTPKCRLMAVDLIEELDAPNESFVNTDTETVHYCPPGGTMAGLPPAFLSMGATTVQLAGPSSSGGAFAPPTAFLEGRPTSYFYPSTGPSAPGLLHDIVIQGFTVLHSRSSGMSLSGVANFTVRDVELLAHGAAGLEGSGLWGGNLINLTIASVGCHGMSVGGGDSSTLTPAGLVVADSRIHDFARVTRTYTPGVAWNGVGLTFRNNTVWDGPHSGVLGGGNDCLFEGNHLHDLCYEATDSGAWYAGRSWVHRGNTLVGNVFENILVQEDPKLGSPAINCVYYDDELSGQTLVNNTFRGCFHGVLLGGGRDNTITGNTFHNMTGGYAVTFDARGLGWQKDYCHCAFCAFFFFRQCARLAAHFTLSPPPVPCLSCRQCNAPAGLWAACAGPVCSALHAAALLHALPAAARAAGGQALHSCWKSDCRQHLLPLGKGLHGHFRGAGAGMGQRGPQ